MLVHSVYFWLKRDADKKSFKAGLDSLKAIEAAEAIYVGSPAGVADRPVVDKSFDFSLTVICKNVEAHDKYQIHELHKAFIEKYKPMFDKVQIYDAE